MTYKPDRQAPGSIGYYDASTGGYILNTSTVPTGEIMTALWDQHPEVASIVRWTNDVHASRNRTIFERDQYISPAHVYQQMRVAYEAAFSDDVVSNVVESTESMAISKMSFEADDQDEEDIWDQIGADLDLDSRFREFWREMFTVSQMVVITWWGIKTYKVRGRTDKGVSRKKTFVNLRVPTGMSIIDPLKVVPVGNFLFNQEQLAYIANRTEAEIFYNVLAGENTSDLLVAQVIVGKYEPSQAERLYLASLDINPDLLFLLNPKMVWRHTDTRPQYERFARVRMRSVFELLDMKHLLREMDRAFLIGGTNFIVLVKIGSDNIPAKAAEVQGLANQVKVQARVPVIVGDHRLSVEIVTPQNDRTLDPTRYNTIDSRIEARLYQMFLSSNAAVGRQADDSLKTARVVARGLEARRHQLMRAFERNVIDQVYEANAQFTAKPKLVFHPKMIALDYDPAFIQLLQDLRDRGDLSRASILDQFDFEQDEEARKRELEADKYDGIFTQPNVPFNSPAATGQPATQKPTPKAAGRQGGGTRNGGGKNADSNTPNSAPVKRRQGNND